MPFRRRYGPQKRKVFRPRKPNGASKWARYGAAGGRLAYKAYRKVMYLSSLINVEKHKVDTSSGPSTLNTTAVTVPITNIAIGDTEGTRTGNTLMTKYMLVKGTAVLSSQGAATARVRTVIVRDKQQIQDSAPGYGDVYESTGTQAFLNKNTVGRFDILYDRIHDLDSNNPQSIFERYIRLGTNHVRYNGTGATDIQKGGLYLYAVSDQAATGPSYGVQVRLGFIDN